MPKTIPNTNSQRLNGNKLLKDLVPYAFSLKTLLLQRLCLQVAIGQFGDLENNNQLD